MTMEHQLKLIIEALLFTSDKPLKAQDILACLPDATLADIKSALQELQAEYDGMGRSIVIKETATGYQFRTLPEYAHYVLNLLKTSPTRLSNAAMETLAIIAYKQPILRHEIERLRGVDAGGILRTLMEKDLIRIVGRKNLPGRPLIYGTTKRFLEVFDLKNLDSLPKLKEIKDFGTEEQGTEMPPREEAPDETSNGEQSPENSEPELEEIKDFKTEEQGTGMPPGEEASDETSDEEQGPEDSD